MHPARVVAWPRRKRRAPKSVAAAPDSRRARRAYGNASSIPTSVRRARRHSAARARSSIPLVNTAPTSAPFRTPARTPRGKAESARKVADHDGAAASVLTRVVATRANPDDSWVRALARALLGERARKALRKRGVSPGDFSCGFGRKRRRSTHAFSDPDRQKINDARVRLRAFAAPPSRGSEPRAKLHRVTSGANRCCSRCCRRPSRDRPLAAWRELRIFRR